MRRTIKTSLLIGGMAASSLLSAWGYALLGPGIGGGAGGDNWETVSIGYGLPGDIGTPKNIGEEYRRNTPVMYYTYDANFLDFFGSNGVVAVDGAFAIMNALTNVDSYSSSLSEFPLDSQESFDSRALGLTDLKSTALFELMEQMGLAEPERYVWTLHDRYLPSGGKCPLDEEYLVVQRNYDPVSQVYSSYVNGTLYTYLIFEDCSHHPPPYDAVTVPFSADPLADTFTAVAGLGDGFYSGNYYTGLTRDDVGGLRYLLSTNNLNVEDPALGSLVLNTNLGGQTLLYTSDLSVLAAAAQTNAPGVLSTLFPGLIVAGSVPYFTNIYTPNIVAYYTNYIGSPNGSPPVLVIATNGFTLTVETNYIDTFANVITNQFVSNNSHATLLTISVTNQIGAPNGAPLVTNTTYKSITLTNVPSGDYYIIPPGLCGYDIIRLQAVNPIASTNVIVAATNSSSGYSFSQSIITYFTNHIYVVEPINCAYSSAPARLYQGVGKIQFVRADYDSLLSQSWNPVTNYYTMVVVTNFRPVVQYFQRIVTQPDILFSAQDFASPNVPQIGVLEFSRNVNFDQNNILNNLAGPGTINPSSTISFNKVGDVYGQAGLASSGLDTNGFLSEFTQVGSLLTWGSFDNSTNDPIVYPDGSSIQNLEYQAIIQISPPTLPDGTNNTPYAPVTFTTTGGTFTYRTWSLATDPSTGAQTVLPSGLALSSGGTISGTPAGNPPGIYDFIIQMNQTDSNGNPLNRTVQWNYSITIH